MMMTKSKSARLAEIDANIQACMRELEGLQAQQVRLGSVNPDALSSAEVQSNAPVDSVAQPKAEPEVKTKTNTRHRGLVPPVAAPIGVD